jgi:hypothetical protein
VSPRARFLKTLADRTVPPPDAATGYLTGDALQTFAEAMGTPPPAVRPVPAPNGHVVHHIPYRDGMGTASLVTCLHRTSDLFHTTDIEQVTCTGCLSILGISPKTHRPIPRPTGGPWVPPVITVAAPVRKRGRRAVAS